MNLWEFALAAWSRPGVSEACLRLQDDYGQCVALFLWRAWTVREGRGVGALDLPLALARRWESDLVAPLRAIRRRLAGEFDGMGASEREALRAQVRALELAAERSLLEALEAVSPLPGAPDRDPLPLALTELARAWNEAEAPAALAALVEALA